jgi:hypothetical protein
VHHPEPRVTVEVQEATGDALDDVEPRLPVQQPSPRRICSPCTVTVSQSVSLQIVFCSLL